MQSDRAVISGRKWAAYICAHGHHFQIDTRTEPEQYVVKCPVCGTVTVEQAAKGAHA